MKKLIRQCVKYAIILIIFLGLPGILLNAQNMEITSPDASIKLKINLGQTISWSLDAAGETIVENAVISLTLDGRVLGERPRLLEQNVSETDEVISAVLPQKNASISNQYKELRLAFEGKYVIRWRVFNNGVAYRFETATEGEGVVNGEQMDLTFPVGSSSLFPQEESMYSHYERHYLKKNIGEIGPSAFASLPVLFTSPQGKRLVFTDADLYDYPNAFVRGNGNQVISITFPKVVLETIPDPESADRSEIITREADYIAATRADRTFPWRTFAIGKTDKELLENELVFVLSRPQEIEDSSWIKPGRVAWDWYNANNIWGVDFESGINNETYKYYIDFASKYGLEYVILDEGWTKSTTEILECNPEINVEELVRYGADRNVGIVLWCLWKPLNENMKEILDKYAGWGVKGIKVDFMQRADQDMVRSYTEIAQECAKRKLLVDFHGAYKPSGLRRAYPNVISYEGVKGNENNKWSRDITPEHNTTLPFIRMVAGPMDFTPGAMRNYHPENFHINFSRPAGMGTRAHQVTMYVIFESAIQMLCDSPSAYLEDEKTVSFISRIPSTWDQTIALDGSIGEFVTMARRKGDVFYFAAMNSGTERTVFLDFSFLPEGNYRATIFKDGVNAGKYAEDYGVEEIQVDNQTKWNIPLIRNGGWTAILTPDEK